MPNIAAEWAKGLDDAGEPGTDMLNAYMGKLKDGEITRQDAQFKVEEYWVGSLRNAAVDGDVEHGSLMAGQSVGIEHQEAKAMQGVCVVKDFFVEGISMDTAMSQVTAYAMSDMFYLPPGTIPPMTMPFDPTANVPLCLVVVSNPQMNETELYDIAYYELRLTGPKQDLHSGTFGGAVTNPAGALVKMLAGIIQPTAGQARVLGYDDAAPVLGREVLAVVLDQIHALGESHSAVQSLGVAICVPRAGYVEEVTCRGADQRWLGRSHHDVIGVIHAEGELAEDVLLGVLRADGIDEEVKSGEITARGGTDDARIECADITGQRPAT